MAFNTKIAKFEWFGVPQIILGKLQGSSHLPNMKNTPETEK